MSTKSAKSNSAKSNGAATAAAPVAKSAAAKSSSGSGVWLSPMSVAALVVLLAVLIQVVTVPSVTGPPSSRKPYSSFQQFYPFYASEHSDTTNRQLHFAGTTIVALLFLLNPRSIPSILLGACVGYLVCPALIGLAHGFVEFAVVIGVFLVTHKLSTGKIGVAVVIPLVGYCFAWVGHFFHEHNTPATFIYPTYSLMGDFNMWMRIAIGNESF